MAGFEPMPQTTLQAYTLATELVIQLWNILFGISTNAQLWQILVIGIISNFDFSCFYMSESMFIKNKETWYIYVLHLQQKPPPFPHDEHKSGIRRVKREAEGGFIKD